jgi:chorismate synthase
VKNTPRNLTTARSTDRIVAQLNKELDRLRVRRDKRELIVDAAKNRCAFRFTMEEQIDGRTYTVVVAKMSEQQNRIQDNMAALHLWLRNRVISLERKIETLEEAFGAHIDVKMSNLPPGFGQHLLSVTMNPGLPAPEGA